MPHFDDLPARDYRVRTVYDGRDLIQALELYYYDDVTGEEVVDHPEADIVIGIDTCADTRPEAFDLIRRQTEFRLRARGVPYSSVEVDDMGE